MAQRELGVRSKADVNLALPPDTKALVLKVWSVNGDLNRAHADWAAADLDLSRAISGLEVRSAGDGESGHGRLLTA